MELTSLGHHDEQHRAPDQSRSETRRRWWQIGAATSDQAIKPRESQRFNPVLQATVTRILRERRDTAARSPQTRSPAR